MFASLRPLLFAQFETIVIVIRICADALWVPDVGFTHSGFVCP